MKKDYKKNAQNVIELQIRSLKKLKKSINNSFGDAVDAIVKCQSKVIICGVGKSGLIAQKISATLSSTGSPSFALSAGDCSHGVLGSISRKDILILISYSGETRELKNIIQYANRNKVTLIGIVSKKNSLLYKTSNIKIFIPEVVESGDIIPTSSTTAQLCLGDALAISAMKQKKFGNLDFKKFHPSGSLGAKLKTVEDVMLKDSKKIPYIGENVKMKSALKIITDKKLGILIVRNKKGLTIGMITDGDLKRGMQKNQDMNNLSIKKIMTKNPISVDTDMLAVKALEIMNSKKITSLCVYKGKYKNKTVGICHIHNILSANIQ
jgi:arabinose-5-phosphate isomerase